ncbi:MAG: multidrug efflux SMR transporter [Coriobacteriia bacterium]|nr:multidrug efflux SMR transporter [Coriobacteriia bacterium]
MFEKKKETGVQRDLRQSKAVPKSFAFMLLGIAIVCEVIATTSLKASNGFTVMPFSLITVLGYAVSISMLVMILKHLPLGLTYGIWGGIGSAATMVVGVAIWGDSFTPWTLCGLVFIVGGTYLLNKGTDEIEEKRKPEVTPSEL